MKLSILEIETIDLNFLPVYALEYKYTAKGKRNVVELLDALTGEVRSGGRRLQDQFRGLITRDLFFDVSRRGRYAGTWREYRRQADEGRG